MKKQIRIALDDKLNELGITRYRLSQDCGIKFQTIDDYYKNRVKRYDSDVLLRICLTLDCDVSEIVKLVEIPENEL